MIKPPLATPIASVLITSLLVQPILAGGTGRVTTSTEVTVEQELSRRQYRQQQAIEAIAKGRSALRAKDYEEAFAQYKLA